ncbi:hypothetical protein ACFXPT_36970 [Streptomyces goshikiensis]
MEEADVTAFSPDQVQELLGQLQAQYGRTWNDATAPARAAAR